MLEKIIIAIVTALLEWLIARASKPTLAVDSDRNTAALVRIGQRVREWEDRARAGGKPATDRAEHQGEGVPDDRRDLDPEFPQRFDS